MEPRDYNYVVHAVSIVSVIMSGESIVVCNTAKTEGLNEPRLGHFSCSLINFICLCTGMQ